MGCLLGIPHLNPHLQHFNNILKKKYYYLRIQIATITFNPHTNSSLHRVIVLKTNTTIPIIAIIHRIQSLVCNGNPQSLFQSEFLHVNSLSGL